MLAQFLATASFVAQLLCWTKSQQHSEKLRLTFLWVSILAALGATYSFASGNLLWPINDNSTALLACPISCTSWRVSVAQRA